MGIFRKNKKVTQIEKMHSYENFPEDVFEAFSSLAGKYNLAFKKDGICSVDIENNYCRLNFNLDRYDLQGLLFKRGDNTRFGITRLASDQNPEQFKKEIIPKSEYGDNESIRKQLDFYAFITDKYLSKILMGDFSWYDRIKKEDDYERELVGLLFSSEFKTGNPIRQKLFAGDKSWKSDIEKYIEVNKIDIKKPAANNG